MFNLAVIGDVQDRACQVLTLLFEDSSHVTARPCVAIQRGQQLAFATVDTKAVGSFVKILTNARRMRTTAMWTQIASIPLLRSPVGATWDFPATAWFVRTSMSAARSPTAVTPKHLAATPKGLSVAVALQGTMAPGHRAKI